MSFGEIKTACQVRDNYAEVKEMSEQMVINITGMSCNHCKMAVEKAIKALAGVKEVQVDLQGGKATVIYDSATIDGEALKAVVRDAGYEVK